MGFRVEVFTDRGDVHVFQGETEKECLDQVDLWVQEWRHALVNLERAKIGLPPLPFSPGGEK